MSCLPISNILMVRKLVTELAVAVISRNSVRTVQLPNNARIFRADLHAMTLAVVKSFV